MFRFVVEISLLIIVKNDIVIAGSFVPVSHDMIDNCGNTIPFSDSMILKGVNLKDSSCTVTINSETAHNGLLLNLNTLYLPDNCSISSLKVVDFLGNAIAGPLCKDKLQKKIFKTGNSVARVKYDSDVTSTEGSSFSLIITSFNYGTNGTCTTSEFQCRNKLCISNKLVCDKVNECSDNSDETSPCETLRDYIKILLEISIPIASIASLIALCACCWCCCKKIKVYAYIRVRR